MNVSYQQPRLRQNLSENRLFLLTAHGHLAPGRLKDVCCLQWKGAILLESLNEPGPSNEGTESILGHARSLRYRTSATFYVYRSSLFFHPREKVAGRERCVIRISIAILETEPGSRAETGGVVWAPLGRGYPS